jgi:hypothetical protein
LIFQTGLAGISTHFSVLRALCAADFVGGKPNAALDHANEFLSLAWPQTDSRLSAMGHWLARRDYLGMSIPFHHRQYASKSDVEFELLLFALERVSQVSDELGHIHTLCATHHQLSRDFREENSRDGTTGE